MIVVGGVSPAVWPPDARARRAIADEVGVPPAEPARRRRTRRSDLDVDEQRRVLRLLPQMGDLVSQLAAARSRLNDRTEPLAVPLGGTDRWNTNDTRRPKEGTDHETTARTRSRHGRDDGRQQAAAAPACGRVGDHRGRRQHRAPLPTRLPLHPVRDLPARRGGEAEGGPPHRRGRAADGRGRRRQARRVDRRPHRRSRARRTTS